MIGHNPYFRLMVNILFFWDFANICWLRLPTGCQQQVRYTKVTSLGSSFHDDSYERSQPILSTNGEHFCIFSDFANIGALRLLTGCHQQARHTKVTSLQFSFQDNSNDRIQPIFSTYSENFVLLRFCKHLRS